MNTNEKITKQQRDVSDKNNFAKQKTNLRTDQKNNRLSHLYFGIADGVTASYVLGYN